MTEYMIQLLLVLEAGRINLVMHTARLVPKIKR